MLSALVRRCAMSGPATSALTRLQASAGLSTSSVVRQQATQDPNDPPYVFKDHCRGKRTVSKEAEEVTERWGCPTRRNGSVPGPSETASRRRPPQAGARRGATRTDTLVAPPSAGCVATTLARPSPQLPAAPASARAVPAPEQAAVRHPPTPALLRPAPAPAAC
jgi:hypothetical protein